MLLLFRNGHNGGDGIDDNPIDSVILNNYAK
jgi:hypothetical protein